MSHIEASHRSFSEYLSQGEPTKHKGLSLKMIQFPVLYPIILPLEKFLGLPSAQELWSMLVALYSTYLPIIIHFPHDSLINACWLPPDSEALEGRDSA